MRPGCFWKSDGSSAEAGNSGRTTGNPEVISRDHVITSCWPTIHSEPARKRMATAAGRRLKECESWIMYII
jgi:hypothetical protein